MRTPRSAHLTCDFPPHNLKLSAPFLRTRCRRNTINPRDNLGEDRRTAQLVLGASQRSEAYAKNTTTLPPGGSPLSVVSGQAIGDVGNCGASRCVRIHPPRTHSLQTAARSAAKERSRLAMWSNARHSLLAAFGSGSVAADTAGAALAGATERGVAT